MNRPKIHILCRKDIPAVVELLHQSFDSRLRPFMTYTQWGIGDFLSVPLKYPGLLTDRTRLVMEHHGEVVGFADFRSIAGNKNGHLSYICVRPSARGQGVATALISEYLSMHPQLEMLSLDVFRDNGPAKALYRKLGFKSQQVSAWITRSLPTARGSVFIESVEASLAAYNRHGFCTLDVRFDQERLNVGLIGTDVVRCFSIDSFENDAALAGLRQVFTSTEQAMTVVPEAGLVDIRIPYAVATLTDRMSLAT